jgi:TonB-linked SusC/RagA family outer membrane protein
MRFNPLKSGAYFLTLICFALPSSYLHAQETTSLVKGLVQNNNNEPLAGVSVIIRNTRNNFTSGTITNDSGVFTFSRIPAGGPYSFSFSTAGFESQTLSGYTIKENITLSLAVKMQESITNLNQVVVVGYGTQKKRDVTGSVTTIKGEELARLPNNNPVASLQGKVAGLTIVNNGRAGAAPTVRIRGVNSTGNADPLYVVDGVFQTNIDYLNPADIESMEVLRDPSSIAIFGLQGGNGVIIVTTKRAGKGETRISFQSSVGIQHVNNRIDVVDAAGFKKLYTAQLANLNAAPFDYTNYTANTDWQDIIFRDAIINNNTLSVSNSGEKTTTLFSIGYNMQEGVLKYDKFQKFIGRLSQELRISKNFKIGGDLTGFHYIQDNPGADLNNGLWAAPIVPVQAGEGLYYSMPSFQRAQVGNPQARLDLNNDVSVNKGYRAVGRLFAELKFLQNFTWRTSFYTDLGFLNSRSYTPLPYRFINLGEGAGKTDTTFDNTARTSVSQTQAEFRKFQQDHTLTFEKTFREKHKITVLAGFTTLYQGSTNVNGNRRDTSLNIPRDPDYWYLNIANANNPVTNGGAGGEESYMSYLGRINYAFAGKYLLNVTYRRDGSSKFSPANRWGNFGSIGAGWVVSDETFFAHVKALDFLKLRAAWGTVGSGLGLPANLYLPGLNTANVGVFGDNVYGSVAPAYIPDPNLHWEVVRGLDIGIDLRAIRNRLSAEITFYDRTTKDILTTLTLPGTAGNYSYRTNLGTITNKGIEISAGWNGKITSEFTYRLNANFSYNRNKVVSIGNNIDFQILGNGGVNKTVTNESIGYFFGYRQTGIYQTVADLDKRPAFVNSLPGDIAFEDVNKDGKLDAGDRTYLGTPFPVYNFGATLNLSYQGFDLIVEGQGVAGNKIYTQRRTGTFAVLNYETNRLNAWSGAGTSNIEPILDNTRANNFLFSSYFLEPGDYFRIRTAQIGYNFSGSRLSKTPIKQLRLYISGQNLFTFSKTTGYSPEASISNPIESGADNGTYPLPAVYSFGVNVTF